MREDKLEEAMRMLANDRIQLARRALFLVIILLLLDCTTARRTLLRVVARHCGRREGTRERTDVESAKKECQKLDIRATVNESDTATGSQT